MTQTNNIESMKDKVAEFDERGFVVIPDVLSAKYVQELQDLTDRIIHYAEKGLADPFRPYYVGHRPQHGVLYDVVQRHPEYSAASRNQMVLDFMSSFLGQDILLYENALIYKSAKSANAVPWHQDFIDRPHEPKKLIVWYALDDVRRENGAMKVIPGSTKNGFLPFMRVEGETHHTRVKPECIDESDAIFAELNAGDALVFDQLLLHCSEEIRSGAPRRALRISYQGFDEIISPRATPLVVRGGTPEALAERFPAKESEKPAVPQKNAIRRLINKAGRFLSRI